jgi:hypothetical protein
VGGGEHDWALLLERLGLLERDLVIGRTVAAAGLLLFLAAIVWGWKALSVDTANPIRRTEAIGAG